MILNDRCSHLYNSPTKLRYYIDRYSGIFGIDYGQQMSVLDRRLVADWLRENKTAEVMAAAKQKGLL